MMSLKLATQQLTVGPMDNAAPHPNERGDPIMSTALATHNTTRRARPRVPTLTLSHPEPIEAGDDTDFESGCEVRLISLARPGVVLWTDSKEHAAALASGRPLTMCLDLPSHPGYAIELQLDRAESELLAAVGLVRLAKRLGYGGPLLQRLATGTASEEEECAFAASGLNPDAG
ncbi:MAG: hypothetical protein AB1762_13730 [Gemmatimonadota bacterium]